MLKLYKNRFLSLAFLAAGFFAFSACDDSSDADDSDKSTENTDKTDDTDTDTTTTTTTDTEGGSCMRECNPGKEGECGEGNKCYSYGCGVSAKQTDATRCLPEVGSKQVNEACTRDSEKGTDDCVPGAFCLPQEGTSVDSGPGTCLAHCDTDLGVEGAVNQCKEKTQSADIFCFDFNAHTLPICLPPCDPLAPKCGDGEACFYASVSHGFICTKPKTGSPGQGGECANEQECASGNACIPKAVFGPSCSPSCDGSNAVCGCCAGYCDLTATENTCGEGLICKEFDTSLEPNVKKVGICTPV